LWHLILVCCSSVFYSLKLISSSCSPHTALCDMIHAVIYWPPTNLYFTKISVSVAFFTVSMSELCNNVVILTVRILVVFVEHHQVFYACKFMVQNITDFETCRKAQGSLFCCLLHHSYMWHSDLFIQNFFTHGYHNDPTIIVVYLML
jgi:hypothetical protein